MITTPMFSKSVVIEYSLRMSCFVVYKKNQSEVSAFEEKKSANN
jgi:hypothetical protein